MSIRWRGERDSRAVRSVFGIFMIPMGESREFTYEFNDVPDLPCPDRCAARPRRTPVRRSRAGCRNPAAGPRSCVRRHLGGTCRGGGVVRFGSRPGRRVRRGRRPRRPPRGGPLFVQPALRPSSTRWRRSRTGGSPCSRSDPPGCPRVRGSSSSRRRGHLANGRTSGHVAWPADPPPRASPSARRGSPPTRSVPRWWLRLQAPGFRVCAKRCRPRRRPGQRPLCQQTQIGTRSSWAAPLWRAWLCRASPARRRGLMSC